MTKTRIHNHQFIIAEYSASQKLAQSGGKAQFTKRRVGSVIKTLKGRERFRIKRGTGLVEGCLEHYYT